MSTTRTMRRMRTRTNGASLGFLALTLACLVSVPAAAQKNRPQASNAVIAGTVFREPGFALPGAEVTLTPHANEAVKPQRKSQRAVSDGRGEFAFQVPGGQAAYTVAVRAQGYAPVEKVVKIGADERLDVYFELKAAK